MRRDRALVLVSGGIDSAVALWWAKSRGWEPIALVFESADRPRGEARAARRLLQRACVRHTREISLPFLRSLRRWPGADGKRPPAGYVPARNLVMYAAAFSLAEREGVRWIVGGHNRSDAAVFPDATRDFFQGLSRLVEQGRPRAKHSLARVVLPLGRLTDAQVIRLGKRLSVPLEETWTCYRDQARACGRCEACRMRSQAFRDAGVDQRMNQ